MPRLSLYVLKQMMGPVTLFAFLMTSVIWLTQSLHFLDLIINRGQSAATFAYLTMLILPRLLVIILPLAFFFGTLYALSRLNSDSELVVMASAGYSRIQLTTPVLIGAAVIMALTYLCSLYLMPAGQRAMNQKVVDIRADVGTALLNEGTFNTLATGLTVFIREINFDGSFQGALVHDNRNPKNPITYIAKNGRILKTPAGARLLLVEGTIEQSSRGGSRLSVLKFDRYPFDLDQFSSPAPTSERETNERYLPELLSPPAHLSEKIRNAYLAEAHNRLAQPLNSIAFALIALAAVICGRRGRGANLLRMTLACAATTGLSIASYGVQGLAAGNPAFCALFYLLPVTGIAGAVFVLAAGHPKPAIAPVPAEAPA